MATWGDIPNLAKQNVIKYLDFESRINLMSCSRDDKSLVESVKHVFSTIVLGGYDKTMVLIQDSKVIELTKMNDETTMVDIFENFCQTPSKTMEVSKTQIDLVRSWIERISKNGVIEASEIKILNISLPPLDHYVLKCDELKLRILGSENTKLWLERTVPMLQTLIIQDCRFENIFDLPQVRNASRCVQLSRDVGISDDQLRNLNAPSVHIHSKQSLTEIGAKEAFKKFIEYSNHGDDFELSFKKNKEFSHKSLFEGSWILEKTDASEDTVGEFIYRICGFKNINGVSVIPTVVIYDLENSIILKAFHFVRTFSMRFRKWLL